MVTVLPAALGRLELRDGQRGSVDGAERHSENGRNQHKRARVFHQCHSRSQMPAAEKWFPWKHG
jgi:hypothetical protein